VRLLAAAIALLIAIPARADVLIDNVNGVTLDAEGRVETFTGVLVGDDGRIEQVLERRDKRPGNVAYKFDGKGRVLMPGLIDTHVRLADLGFLLLVGSGELESPDRSKARPEDRDLAFAKAQQALLAQGITTVADMGTTIEDWQTYRRAGDLGGLHMRIAAYAGDTQNMALIGGPGPTPWLYEDRLRFNGLFLRLDGSLASRSAYLKQSYADAPDERGDMRMTGIQLRNVMSRGAIDNFQVAVEAHGDAAVSETLDAVDELAETYAGERRWLLEAVETADGPDILRLKRHGVIATVHPAAAMRSTNTVEQRLGPGRLAQAHPWRSLAAGGATVVLGSGDNPGITRPFATMAAAATRQDAAGQPFGGWQPQEALNREQALDGYTRNAAFALYAEGRLGRIAEGMRGDFILIDRDPLLSGASEFRDTRVLQTWVGGKLVYDAEGEPPEGR